MARTGRSQTTRSGYPTGYRRCLLHGRGIRSGNKSDPSLRFNVSIQNLAESLTRLENFLDIVPDGACLIWGM